MEVGAAENVLEAELKRIIDGYRPPHGVKCAVLYGSRVSGEVAGESDVDVLLVTDGEGLDALHEFVGDVVVEFVLVGEETLDRMVSESNPYVASVFLSGKPLYNERYVKKIKNRISMEGLRRWAKKYCSDALKRLGKSVDKGDAINTAILLLNAYLLAKGELRLSYSVDKLARRIDDKELLKLLKTLLGSDGSDAALYAEKIADIVRPTVLEKA